MADELKQAPFIAGGKDYQKPLAALADYVKMVADGHGNSLFVIGEGGIGKTEVTLKTLKDGGYKFNYFTTFSTPMELYSYLYIHQNDLIVLDDVDGVIDNKKSVAILKSCLWGYDNKRDVQYLSSSPGLMVPPRFEFKGRTIFLLNEPPKNKFLASLITRSVCYEIKLSFDNKIAIMRDIAMQDFPGIGLEDRMRVFNFIKENSSEATEEVNFRTLIKAFSIFKYSKDRWMELVRLMLKSNNDLVQLKTIMRGLGDLPVMHQIRAFEQETGKSRRTFFRYKKRLEDNR